MSLQVNNLSKSFSVRTLFSGVTFSVNPGECVALVGNNGSGKSTMMRIILGEESSDSGNITTPKNCKIGYLPQEIFLSENQKWETEKETLTLWELVTQAFDGLKAIKERIESLEAKISEGNLDEKLHEDYEKLIADYEKSGGYSWQAKTIRLLKGFGFKEERFHEPLKNFSGGWQMRAFFARILLREPDYLLLDEPTNYLDIASIDFLEDYLSNYEGGILVVSHDRYFLDELATSVVAIMPEGSRTFKGNYSEFLEAREEWATEAAAAQERQDKERKRIERFVERFRYKATKASQVQSRVKMLAKMKEIAQIRSTPKLSFRFPECEPSGEVVLRAEHITKSFGNHEVLKDVSFLINRGDRVAIIGENGAGKTTLVRILVGEDNLWGGKLETGYRTHLGYFAQDEEISFEGEETVEERMLRDAPFDAVPEVRNILGAFLFSGDNVKKMVKVLSGGEKSRLGLARMMLRPCNLLILDEPTNHLDISSREALLNALDDFPGTVIIVSHDRFFLDSLATRVLSIEKGKSILYDGNYSQYMWAKERRLADEQDLEKSINTKQSDKNIDLKQQARDSMKYQKQLSNRLQKLKKDIEAKEYEISVLESNISEIEGQLAAPPEEWSPAKIAEVAQQHSSLNAKLDEAMNIWENLNAENQQTSDELKEIRGGK